MSSRRARLHQESRRKAASPVADGASVRLHIERIVLDGFSFDTVQMAQLHNSLEQELGSLLRHRKSVGRTGSEAFVRMPISGAHPGAPALNMHDPAQLGCAIAWSICSCLEFNQ